MKQNDTGLKAQGHSVQKQNNKPGIEKSKIISIIVLMVTSIAIIAFGAAFSIYSIIDNISFTVFSSQMNGAIFGAVIIFLGVRYFLSVRKLKAEVYKSTSKFSWSNFKKQKAHKSL